MGGVLWKRTRVCFGFGKGQGEELSSVWVELSDQLHLSTLHYTGERQRDRRVINNSWWFLKRHYSAAESYASKALLFYSNKPTSDSFPFFFFFFFPLKEFSRNSLHNNHDTNICHHPLSNFILMKGRKKLVKNKFHIFFTLYIYIFYFLCFSNNIR